MTRFPAHNSDACDGDGQVVINKHLIAGTGGGGNLYKLRVSREGQVTVFATLKTP
jgi:hypothetical protein